MPWRQLTTEGYELSNFDCQHSGIWQTIDNSTKYEIENRNLDLIIKFGMNLLKHLVIKLDMQLWSEMFLN